VYDGHGGSLVADFLRDNLHKYVLNDTEFPSNVKEAIKNGFAAAEEELLSNHADENSGS
jgi:protein phosphatase 2C family protein 2/3